MRDKIIAILDKNTFTDERAYSDGLRDDVLAEIESLFTQELQQIKGELEGLEKHSYENDGTSTDILNEMRGNYDLEEGYNQAISKAIELIDRRIRG